MLQYVPRVLGPVLAASGVLVCHEVVQLASGRFPADELRRGVLVVAASLSIWLLVPIGWLVMPSLDWNKENNATLAHLAAAPDGRSSAFAPAEMPSRTMPSLSKSRWLTSFPATTPMDPVRVLSSATTSSAPIETK